ncbi:MAG: carbamoyltransferase HypF, partial [Mariniphaga sp.]|nr:carbamoyltransferase HypF [Mariniphaga sp.]
VQGVGFRPFIYRLAKSNQISGWVKNCDKGVIINASGKYSSITKFINQIKEQVPETASIYDLSFLEIQNNSANGFRIIQSESKKESQELTQIGPDIAVCRKCLDDLKTQQHRISYPLINCTNCGPRFSIIKDLPYDRSQTTMNTFNMCNTCQKEYGNVDDRRFHAQPIACNNCGPVYKMILNGNAIINLDQIINTSTQLIDNGKIIAVKGVGGFFIACDAFNNKTILRLRQLKNREGKPLAVMFRNIKKVNEYCFTNEEELKYLQSWQRPVVILKEKKKFPESVSNGLFSIGALLPYMPFHYMLFENIKTDAIIFTSGNFSDEPIITDNIIALDKLPNICDAIVYYNREIYNRTDDSVIKVINGKAQIYRRSRGYAPTPVQTKINVDKILATGGELKNTFCLGRDNSAILSQHIGDLKESETADFYSKNIPQFLKMFRVKPELIVHDLHPDYYSTTYAQRSGLPTLAVQHHHAHIVSCMVEHGLDEEVIGVCFDGTGFGDDGHIWGSEFFICDLKKYKRLSHFEYMPLPGGDLAIKEPWRMAVSLLYQSFGADVFSLNLKLFKKISPEKIDWLIKAIDNNINCPLSSGAGRLFDAVSAILGLCYNSTFEAEAPIRLENIADYNEIEQYTYEVRDKIIFKETIKEIVADINKGINPEKISGKLHNTVVSATCEKVVELHKTTGLQNVVLSGGTFQNKILLEKIYKDLNEKGFNVFTHSQIPANDGGISLGQLLIAAKNRK